MRIYSSTYVFAVGFMLVLCMRKKGGSTNFLVDFVSDVITVLHLSKCSFAFVKEKCSGERKLQGAETNSTYLRCDQFHISLPFLCLFFPFPSSFLEISCYWEYTGTGDKSPSRLVSEF